MFRGAAETHADVLGEAGLARYRQLAEAECQRGRTLVSVPGGHDRWDPDLFNITYVMESLAQAFHDVDMEIAVRSRDLSSAYRFFELKS